MHQTSTKSVKFVSGLGAGLIVRYYGFTHPHLKVWMVSLSHIQIFFFLIFMEKVKQNPGKHVLFGDNIASHFNM